MGRINSYPKITRPSSSDVAILDGSSGTRVITLSDLSKELPGMTSVEMHRNTFRGKNLGGSYTDAQKAAVKNGTFDDLYVGDYWNIDGISWTIADIDYWYNCGDTILTKHHLVIVPNKPLYNAKMNETSTTEGGYAGSLMRTENLKTAKTTISTIFGNALLTHRTYLVTGVEGSHPSDGGWFDSDIELMNEIMLYGCPVYLPAGNGSTIVNRYTTDKQQLALFALSPRAVNIRANYWLRDIASSISFVRMDPYGGMGFTSASGVLGVRPVFGITGG